MKSKIIILTYLTFLVFITIGCKSNNTMEMIGTQVAQAVELTQSFNNTQIQKTIDVLEKTQEITETASTTPSPTATESQTSSPTPEPSQTPSPTITETITETPTNTPIGYIPEGAIWFYATSIGTGGPIGCGDTLIKLWTGYIRTGDIRVDLTNALNTVFSVGPYAAGFYNATYPSSLRVKEVKMSANGTATVYFDGAYVPPKDSCDASRFRSQVWGTALQFPEVTRFIPWIGDKLLGDRLAAFSDSGK